MTPSTSTSAPPLRLSRSSDWPRTTRVLPWAVAAFLVIVWLVPFDSIQLPISVPVDPKPDRAGLLALLALWAVVALVSPDVRYRRSALDVALLAFVAVAAASLAANFAVLANLNEMSVGVGKLGLLMMYVALFYVVSTSVRRTEVPALLTLTLVLACVAAVGTISEYQTDENPFRVIWDALLPSSFTVAPDPVGEYDVLGRPTTVGPTEHGLAVSAMMALALPIAFARLALASTTGRRVLYLAALVVLVAGALATVRKSSLILPLVAVAPLILWRPRLLAIAAIVVAVVALASAVLSPGALDSVVEQLTEQPTEQSTTSARLDDYDAVVPEFATHPLLGRGYGTFDPERYRFLDNQYLMTLVDTGVAGLLAYLAVVIAAALTGAALLGRGSRIEVEAGLVALSAAAVLLVATALFDVLSFGQIPYVFLSLVGLAVAAAPQLPRREVRRSPAPAWVPVEARK